eukprot:PhF_6_TR40181/c0_g5_i8/m.59588/K08770/UBC; ubiquitin C
MSHTPRGNDADAFEGTPYDHRMSTMCEMDEIFSSYCQNSNLAVATIGLVVSGMTSLPMDTIQCVLSFAAPSTSASSRLPKGYTIIVRTLTGMSHPVDVTGDSTIESIKIKIQDKVSIRAEHQCFVFRGEFLEDDGTLEQHNIGNDSTLILVQRGPTKMIETETSDQNLFPTKLIVPPGKVDAHTISQIKDCFGDVPFEQRGDQLVLGRPTVNPIVEPMHVGMTKQDRPMNIRQPLIRMKILQSEDNTAKPILTKIPHEKTLPYPLTKGGLAFHFRSVV